MGLSRRSFLAASGAASAAAVAAGCGGDEKPEERRRERNAGDLEIVKFLLEIEQVEAAFYDEVEQRGGFSAGAGPFAAAVARNEREHVRALDRWATRLGGEKPAAPKTDVEGIFAAGGDEVLASAASLENLAAAAYLGQINRVQDRNLLATLLAIHTVEGRQAAALNRLAGRGFSIGGALEGATPDGAFAEPMEMDTVRVRLRRYTGGTS